MGQVKIRVPYDKAVKFGVADNGSNGGYDIEFTVDDNVLLNSKLVFTGGLTVNIPSNVKKLVYSSFRDNTGRGIINYIDTLNMSGVEEIGDGQAGQGVCSSTLISEINFGNDLTKIGSYAFAFNNRLHSVVLPTSLESIGYYAFFNYLQSGRLTDVYYMGSEEQWNSIDIDSQAFPEDVVIHYNSERR